MFLLLFLVDARVVQGFGAGEGELVLLSEVECTGAEEKLTMCDYIGIGDHSCDRENSAGVACGRGIEYCTFLPLLLYLCDI